MDGGNGNDSMGGGNGNDSMNGGDGNDTMDGGDGNDTMDGGNGNDSMGGGNGNDSMNGGDGNDTMDGGDGNDTIDGGGGDNALDISRYDEAVLAYDPVNKSGTVTFKGKDGKSYTTVFNHINSVIDNGRAVVEVTAISQDTGNGSDFITTDTGLAYSGTVTPATNTVVSAAAHVKVELINSSGSVIATDTVAITNGTWSWNRESTTENAGTYTLRATIVDASGNRFTAKPVANVQTPAVAGNADTDPGVDTQVITIDTSNDAPVAVNDTATALEASGTGNATAGTNPAGNVLTDAPGKDSDPEGDVISVKDIVKGTSGTASAVTASTTSANGTTIAGNFGSLKIGADGSYVYTVDNINATVQGLNTGSTALTDTFTYTVKDPAGLTGTATITVSINGANDAPVLTTTSTARSYTENATAIVANNDLSLSDVDSANLTGATVQITSGLTTGDALSFTAANGITGTYDATAGKLTLTGTATVAQYQTALQTVTYSSTSDTPTASSASRTLTWQVNDGASANNLSSSVTSTINVTAVNDAPVVTPNTTARSYTENATAIVANNNLSLSDVDSADLTGATVQITSGLTTGDVLAFANTAKITGTYAAGTGKLTLSGTATKAEYQAALQAVTYSSTSDNPTATSASRTLTWQVNDGASANNLSTTATSTVNVTAVNDAPVGVNDSASAIEASGTGNATAGTNPTGNVINGAGADTDVDNATNALIVQDILKGTTGTATAVALSTTSANGTNIAGNFGSLSIGADGSYVYTLDNTNGTVQGLNTSSSALTDTFTYTVKDPAGLSSTATITVSINGANDAPVVTTNSTARSYTENAAAIIANNNLSLSDVDSSNLTEATVQITSGLTAGDVLSFTAANGITGTYDAAAGKLTLTGSATVAQYQTALQTVKFSSTSDTPTATSASRTLTWRVNDGATAGNLSNSATSTIDLTAVNDAPTNTVPSAQSTGEDTAKVITGLQIADLDAGSSTVTVTLSVDHGTISLVTGTGVTLTTNGTSSVQLSGTVTAINALLATASAVTYTPTQNYNGADTLTVLTSDGGNTGSGGTLTATSTVGITVTSVNDAPVITTEANSLSTTEDTSTSFVISTQLSGKVTDADGTALKGIVIVQNTSSSGTWAYSTDGTTWVDFPTTYLGTIDWAKVMYLNASDRLRYTPAANTNGTDIADLNFRAVDATFPNTASGTQVNVNNIIGGSGAISGQPGHFTVSVSAVNDAPVVTTSTTARSFTENATAVIANNDLTLTDVDSANLTGATVQITSGLTTGDTLAFTAANGITGAYDSATGKLTMSGSATVVQYQTALQSVTYVSSSDNPTGTSASRTLTWQVNDGAAANNLSSSKTSTINVTQLNDRPTFTSASAIARTGTEDTALSFVISDALAGEVSDVDPNASVKGIAINWNQSASTEGTWEWSSNGTTWTALPSDISTNNTANALYLNASDRLRFTPAANWNGTVPSLVFRVADDTMPTTASGTRLNVNDFTSGTGAMSQSPSSFSVSIAAVNDAPVLTTTSTARSYTENATAIVANNDLSLSDVDSANLTGATVQITSGLTTGDALSFTAANGITGTYDATAGKLTLTGTATVAQYQTALQTVTYSSTSDTPTASSASRTLTWQVNDGASANNLSSSVTSTINVTAVNDAPVVTPNTTARSYTENATAIVANNNLSLSDVDSADLTGATVQITSGLTTGDVLAFANTAKITGTYAAGTGKLTLSGTATKAEYQAALQAVTYSSTSDNPTATSASRTLTWQVNDGASANNLSTTATSTVNVTAVNDAPTAANATLTVLEDGSKVFAASDFGFSDVDGNSLSAVIITSLPSAGTLKLNGTAVTVNQSVTAADIAAGKLVFAPAADANGSSYASIGFKVQDNAGTTNGGVDTSATANTLTINVTAVNDAPVLADTTLAFAAVLQGSAAPTGAVGSLVSSLVGGISDVDTGAVKGIAITAFDSTNGKLFFSTNGGTTWTEATGISNTNALLLASDADNRIYFQPNASFSGTASSAVTFRAWDKTTGAEGDFVSTATNGGTSAFSSATDTLSELVVRPVTINAVSTDNIVAMNEAVTLTGKADPNATVTLNVGGTTRTVTANASGDWTYTPKLVPVVRYVMVRKDLDGTFVDPYNPKGAFDIADIAVMQGTTNLAAGLAVTTGLNTASTGSLTSLTDASQISWYEALTPGEQWVQVDLGGYYRVDQVVITDREGWASRTNGSNIYMSSTNLSGKTSAQIEADVTSGLVSKTVITASNASAGVMNGFTTTAVNATNPDNLGTITAAESVSGVSSSASSTVTWRPADSLTIVSAVDNTVGATPLALGSGAKTSDSTPTLQGTLRAPLASGEEVAIWINNAFIGAATVSGTTWSYELNLTNPGAYTYQALVTQGHLGTATQWSNLFTINRDAAPVNTLPSAFAVDINSTTTLSGLSIADSDAGSATMLVKLEVTSGTLNATAGSTTLTSAGTGTMFIAGTVAQVNAALATVTYSSTTTGGTPTLKMTTSDQLGTVTSTDVDSSTITVAAPSLAITAATATTQSSVVDSFSGLTADVNYSSPSTNTSTTLWNISAPLGLYVTGDTGTSYSSNWVLGGSSIELSANGGATSTNTTLTFTPRGGASFSGLSFVTGWGDALHSPSVPLVVKFYDASNTEIHSSSFTFNQVTTLHNTYSFSTSFTGQATKFTITTVGNNAFAIDDLTYTTAAGATPYSVAAGGTLIDTTPDWTGTINRALVSGETVEVLRDGVVMGNATISVGSTTWTYTDPTAASVATHSYTARLKSGSTVLATSSAFSLKIAATPLVLDLNGDGVHTTSITEGTQFDLLVTGTKQNVGWVEKHDGLLAMDLNGDGQINSGAELFGDRTVLADGSRAVDGWAALRGLDSNHDGKIDAHDAQFNQLRVWVDADSDGVTDAGELHSLTDQGIASIDLAADGRSVQQNGNVVQAFSTYNTIDGATHEVADVGFAVQDSTSSGVYTLANAASLDLSKAASIATLTSIDMASDSAANTVKLTLNDVLATGTTNGVHKLTLTGDANDSVDIDVAEWTNSGTTVTEGTHTYAVYNANGTDNAQLLIDQTMLNANHVS
jgi:VCBS repeat-containing protein